MYIILEKHASGPWSVNTWFVFESEQLARRWINATMQDGVLYDVQVVCPVRPDNVDYLLSTQR